MENGTKAQENDEKPIEKGNATIKVNKGKRKSK